MHRSTTEHSKPEIVGDFKVYQINGTTFEVPHHYTVMKVLGFGASGVTCSALNTKTNEKVAIKKHRKVFRDTDEAKRLLRELILLRFLQHENILGVTGILPPLKAPEFEDVYLMPLMDVDMNVVLRSRQVLDASHYQFFIYQVLRALKFLHSANIVHHALKPSNLTANITCEVRICDLMSREELEDDDHCVLNRWYTAPEQILGARSASCHQPAVDIWSTGCILAEMFERKAIFPGKSALDQLQLQTKALGRPSEDGLTDTTALKVVRDLPERGEAEEEGLAKLVPSMEKHPVALDFLSKMLVMDPKQRWTAEQLLAHPFLVKLHDPTDEPTATKKTVEAFWEEYNSVEKMTPYEVRQGFWKRIVEFSPLLATEMK